MATTTNSGSNFQIRNITLNSSSDTPIDFDQEINSATMRARTSVDVYIRKFSGAADYFTIPGGGSLTLDVASIDRIEHILCYARAASGNPILEIIGTF